MNAEKLRVITNYVVKRKEQKTCLPKLGDIFLYIFLCIRLPICAFLGHSSFEIEDVEASIWLKSKLEKNGFIVKQISRNE